MSNGELRSLSYQFGWGDEKTEQMHFFLSYFRNITIDTEDILNSYALLDAYSERAGRSMGKNDPWIAATAHATGACILTSDLDFEHLSPDLIPLEWIDPKL